MLRSLVLIAALLASLPVRAHEEHHPTKADEPPINYSSWENQKGENCCNNQDCSPIADADVQETPVFKVRIEGKWCPVLGTHFLKKGNAPDWGRNHACIRKESYDMDMGAMGMTRAPAPSDPCAKLLCFQPRPQI